MKFKDYLNESVKMIFVGEDGDEGDEDMDDLRDQGWTLAKQSSIRILSDKNLSQVAVDNGRVLGALFTSAVAGTYSFDIVADPRAGQVLSLTLIRAGIAEYQMYVDSGDKMELQVVNPRLVPILQKRFGFRIVRRIGETAIMRPTKRTR